VSAQAGDAVSATEVSATVAITTGEPAGIGPEICLQALAQARKQFPHMRFVLLGDRGMLTVRARKLGVPLRLTEYLPERSVHLSATDSVEVLHHPLAHTCEAGKLNPINARYVLNLLDRAIKGAQQQEFAAIITAPVHKAVINEAGIAFSGHTEYFAAACGVQKVVMMLAGGGMRVALATTHIPVRAVPDAINQHSLLATLQIIDHDLRQRFGIAQPRILVAGLNPHAGENGYIGREEIEVITPVIQQAQAQGIAASGPFPADTLFQTKYLHDADCVLAMYHDQGLPVLKHASFGRGVNITLGLPLVRVSVDHGTALDLAGTGQADHGSLLAAVRTTAEILAHA